MLCTLSTKQHLKGVKVAQAQSEENGHPSVYLLARCLNPEETDLSNEMSEEDGCILVHWAVFRGKSAIKYKPTRTYFFVKDS